MGALDQRGLALELAARPLSLKLIRPEEAEAGPKLDSFVFDCLVIYYYCYY